jgi:hypothetical protein
MKEVLLNNFMQCRIWGFHSGGYEEFYLQIYAMPYKQLEKILKKKNWQWNHGSVGFDVNTSYN